jgi:hypothetical protein
MRKGLTLFATYLSVTLAAASAFAQSSAEEDKAQARELAKAGFAALDAQDWARAEDAFRRADAIYHAPTLTVALARAQVHLGKLVEAWESYHRVVVEGALPGANEAMLEAVENAKKEIGPVEQRRATVTLDVSGAAHPTLTLDGVPIDAFVSGVPRPVNPGTHSVHAAADGSGPLDTSFTVAEGGTASVAVHLVALSARGPDEDAMPPAPSGPRSHALAFVAFGVGGAGLLTGAITGALASGKHGSLKDSPCSSGRCPDPTTFNSDLSSYHTLATVSTIGFVVGGVGAAAGGLLLFLAPRAREPRSAVQWRPYLGLGSGGVAGRF